MGTVRPPAVAGLFYPSSPGELSAQVSRLLREAGGPEPVGAVKALIAPHAGYVYSGPTAAIGYSALTRRYERVVLLGPCHQVGTPYLALPAADSFATPLGDVPVWAAGARMVAELPDVIVGPEVHAREHSLEVQLPFIQTVLEPGTPVLPLAVGWAKPEAVARVLEAVWGGGETLIVVSSDLSHYLPYATAQEVDEATLAQVMALSPDLLGEQACGAYAVNGLNLAARRRGLRPRVLEYRNSGDTAGDHSRVVGYAAVIYEQEADHAA